MDFNSWNDNTTALQNAHGYGGAAVVATAVVVAVPDNRARIEVGHIATAVAAPVVGLPADLLEDIKTIPFRQRWAAHDGGCVAPRGADEGGWLRQLPHDVPITSDEASLAFYGPLIPGLDEDDFNNIIMMTSPSTGDARATLNRLIGKDRDLGILYGSGLYRIKYVNNIVDTFIRLQKLELRVMTMYKLPESQHEYKWMIPNYHLLEILKDNGVKGRSKLANNKYSSLTNTRVPAIRALMAL